MPVIPLLGISKGKPTVTLLLCSEKRYNIYMKSKEHEIYPYSFSAKFLKKYLKQKKVNVVNVKETVFAFSKQGDPHIMIWKHAIAVDAHDVKQALNKINLYDDFIIEYSEKLKNL